MSDKMIQGLYVNEPHENAPDFIKCCLSVQVERFAAWLAKQEPSDKGYIKIDIKQSREGKLYAALNDYTPNKQREEQPITSEDDIPF